MFLAEYSDKKEFIKDISIGGLRPELDNIGPELAYIMERCWDRSPDVRPSFTELIPMLQHCRIDINMPSFLCRFSNELFKKKFSEKRSYELNDVITAVFGEESSQDGIKVKMLATFLFGNEISTQPFFTKDKNKIEYKQQFKKSTIVTPKKFSKLLRWLGPLPADNPNTQFIQLKTLFEQPWFFGSIDRQSSVNCLKKFSESRTKLNINAESRGIFLVRLNTGGQMPIERAPFVIDSILFGSGDGAIVVHKRVYPYQEKSASGYSFTFEVDNDRHQLNIIGELTDFIEELQKNFPSHYNTPCRDGYPFDTFFADNFDSGGGGY